MNNGHPNTTTRDQKNDRCWISDYVETGAGSVPVVKTTLQFEDRVGSWKARWGINRMSYAVEPGLYATGSPDSRSPVFVSANYKMSFDALRSVLGGIASWILVLDTKGINVWCAAGKGTFGTAEIVNRIEETGLSKVVSHRTLVAPQLGAPGVSAHRVKEQSGFRVVYGPVRAADLPQFMEDGMKATAEMRRVRFGFRDRLVLIPIELVLWMRKWSPLAIIVLFLLGGFSRAGFAIDRALLSVAMYLAAFLCGTVLTPLALPWIPGRAFSVKGALTGFLSALLIGWLRWRAVASLGDELNILAWLLLMPAISSFLAMNFTGASTFTSLSGVRREMRFAVPAQIVAAAVGLLALISGQFLA